MSIGLMNVPLTGAVVPWIGAEEVFARVGYLDSLRAIQRALSAGLDPSSDVARQAIPVSNGHLLLMPAESAHFVGVKIASVAPGNPARGHERIQGVYVLMDAETLTPLATMDGAALTMLRTPAVSAAIIDLIAVENIEHMVVFGAGPQAAGHIRAIEEIRKPSSISIVSRSPESASALVEEFSSLGVPISVGSPEVVSDAQLVVCATSTREPLFSGDLISPDCCVVAVGSHEPDVREIDSSLMARAQVFVEDKATALREAGDVVIPVDEGALSVDALSGLASLFGGEVDVNWSRPRVFKGSGMSWQDVVIASEVYQRRSSQSQTE